MSSLSERDSKIDKIKNVIENRKKLLREIYKGIRDSTEENEYLKGIVSDYKSYYDNMKKQKETQIESLQKLVYYMDAILQENKHNPDMLRQAKEDKKNILREINKIKREMEMEDKP